LPKNRHLTNLDLSENLITDHGGLVLGVAIRKREAKTNLHVFGNLEMSSESYERLEELLVDLLELKTSEEVAVHQQWEEEKVQQERQRGKQERSRMRKEARRKQARVDAAEEAEAEMGAYLTQMRGLLRNINGLIDLHQSNPTNDPPSEKDTELVSKARLAIGKILREKCSEEQLQTSGATYVWDHGEGNNAAGQNAVEMTLLEALAESDARLDRFLQRE
jgi:hypothetical protein